MAIFFGDLEDFFSGLMDIFPPADSQSTDAGTTFDNTDNTDNTYDTAPVVSYPPPARP